MREYVIIVAGGSGSRMEGAIPKQFQLLAGKPVLEHAVAAFRRYNPDINVVVVVPAAYEDYWKAHPTAHAHTVVSGGASRFESVRNGLAAITGDEGIVGVHDAARPLVSAATIETCYRTAAALGNAVPVIALVDSLRRVEGTESVPVDRTAFRIVQTPQCFSLASLRRAYAAAESAAFTDDATVVEAAGEKLHLVAGNRENIKLTVPADLKLAEALLKTEL